MIRTANYNDVPQIKSLWAVSFGDSSDYIDFFINNRFDKSAALVFTVNEQIVSMLFLLKCDLAGVPGRYIYAACTHPDYRSNGYMASLLNYAKDNLQLFNADFLCLVPAERSLFDYYSRFGFEEYFYVNTAELQNKKSTLQYSKITAEQYYNARQSFFAMGGMRYLNWDEAAIKYTFDENMFNGGAAVQLGSSVLMYREDGDVCEVIELLGDLPAAFPFTNCSKILIRSPFKTAKINYNAMLYTKNNELLQRKPVYFALYLD